MTTKFFLPLSFVAVFGSWIRDPGLVKIRIRNKHHGSATLQKLLLNSQKYGFGIQDSRSGIRKKPIPDRGSRSKKSSVMEPEP